jgi:O-antigen/teichoic acid export membrane protein
MIGFMKDRKNKEAGFLTFVNVGNSFLGFLVGIYNARLLGPEAYGVIAIISGINLVALNFLDIRLTDLAGKLYYQKQGFTEKDVLTYRSSVIGLCLIGNGIVSASLFIIGLAANIFFIHLFTKTQVHWQWILMQTLASVLGNWASTFYFLQRFSNRYYLMGAWRLMGQLLMSTSMVLILTVFGDLNGYFIGQVVGYLILFIITVLVSLYIWFHLDHLPSFFGHIGFAYKDYKKNIRFIIMGNFLGYTKLLHRGGDSLLMGFFANDRITGLYKLARSLTDSLYMLFDSLNQVYGPRFLEMLTNKEFVIYRKYAGYLILGAGGFTGVVIACEVLFFPWVNQVILNGRFNGIEETMIILTIPFLFVTGFYLWYWPIFIYSGNLGSYTAVNALAAVAQYGSTVILISTIGPGPISGAIGYLVFEILVTVGAVLMLSKRMMEIFPDAHRSSRI